jgi:rhodanese-related sulfurtransferase
VSAAPERRPELEAETPEAIFAAAAARAREMALPYAGAVTPAEAHRLHAAGAARIVDVRTPQEWQFVGHVDGAPLIEWPRGADNSALSDFAQRLQETLDPAVPVLFLCRSGVRSHYAAQVAAGLGFRQAYNILEGFEGNPGIRSGWRDAGLPWKRI